jgi:hypothetical protein
MGRPLYFGTLAAAFGLAAWAGFQMEARRADAAAEPADGPAPPRPAGPAKDAGAEAAPGTPALPALSGAPMGDTDSGGPPAKRPADDGKPIRITFNDLSQWDLDPKDVQVPGSILALGGKTIDIVGYMIPYGNPDAVEEFVLVRDLGSCCFGQTPLPHHIIECRFERGKSVSYVPGPVRTRGRFRVEEHRQGQYLVSVYAMTVSDCVEVR